jgi:hypothetical protein
MKKRFLTGVVLLASLAFSTVAFSQTSSGAEQERGGWGGGRHQGGERMRSPEAQLDRLSNQLQLTDGQKEKIKPILEDQAKQFSALQQDTSVSHQDKFSKFQEIRQDTFSQIRPILNSDQQKKLDKMSKRQQEHRGRGGRRHEGSPQ